jgi:hypothetical protein
VRNDERHSLARIPLRWMIRECFKANTGIIFDAHMLKHNAGMDIDAITEAPKQEVPPSPIPLDTPEYKLNPWWKKVGRTLAFWNPTDDPKAKPRVFIGAANEELKDAYSPIYDQLDINPLWNVLEVWPWCKLSPQYTAICNELTGGLKGML